MNIPIEFTSRVEVARDGCWNWLGWTTHTRGGTGAMAPYGVFQRNKKFIIAHRHFFELATGVVPGPQGHPYVGDNVQRNKNGGRRCAACNRNQYHKRKLLTKDIP